MKFLRLTIISVLEFTKIVMTKHLVDALQAYASRTSTLQPQLLTGDPLNSGSSSEISLRKVLTLMTMVFSLEFLAILMRKIEWIYSDLIYKQTIMSFETLLFEQKLASKYNDIHAKRFKANVELATYLLTKSLFELMDSAKATGKSLFMLAYGLSIFGPKFVILIVGIALSSLYRYAKQKEYSQHDKEKQSMEIEINCILRSVFDKRFGEFLL